MQKSVIVMIILSVVWSIVSGIIAKKKAAAQKAAAELLANQSGDSTEVLHVSPTQVRVESLRRRKKSVRKAQLEPEKAQPRKRKPIEGLKKLHIGSSPLPPSQSRIRRSKQHARQIALLLKNRRNLRTAIVLNEILSAPIALRTTSSLR